MELKSLLVSFANDLLFPEQLCLFCEKPIHNRSRTFKNQRIQLKDICITCQDQIQIPSTPYCTNCHKTLGNQESLPLGIRSSKDSDPHICFDCKQNSNRSLETNRSATRYNEFLKEYLALYKYRGKESLAVPLSHFLKIAYDQHYKTVPIDFITYVPLHSTRLQERSFNQAEQLARQLGLLIGKPVMDSLERTKETHKQSKRGKWERKEEMKGAFRIKEDGVAQIKGKSVLIIDDIYTTGATLNACANELKVNGVDKVYSLTLARA